MKIFDRYGSKVGYTSDSSGCGVIIAAGIFIWILFAITKAISSLWIFLFSYASHSFPYNLIAAFYYFCTLPFRASFSGAYYWHYVIVDGNLTPYINVNKVLGIIVWLALVTSPFVVVFFALSKTRLRKYKKHTLLIFLFPAIAGLIWLLISSLIAWITIKSV